MSKRKKEASDKIENEITAERDRLKAILDSMDDGIYIVGRDYRITFMNRTLRSEIGDGEGCFCHELFHYEREYCEECQHGMSSFGPHIRRELFLPKTQKTYDMAVSPIHEPDGHISRLHILRDITERKKLELKLQEYTQMLETKVAEQTEMLLRRERVALLAEISAGLAHEIRTPLGAIITGIRLLEKGGQSQKEYDLIYELLGRETTRLERKLSEFLSYAKPRLPQPMDVFIPSLFENIKNILLTDKQLAGDVTIKLVVDPSLTTWSLDPEQIKEALLNICMNALQALGGKGMLSIGVRSRGEALEIFVNDNGPGIPSDALPHIFEPFYSRRSEGTGLGLAISKEIIESQGGRITVTSVPYFNTTFRITLPPPKNLAGKLAR
jgi:signal transduction histidine kinase